MSPAKRPRPVTSGGSSSRSTERPIQVVASTADQWDDRLKQMFGGATHQENALRSTPTTKPGAGGYL